MQESSKSAEKAKKREDRNIFEWEPDPKIFYLFVDPMAIFEDITVLLSELSI